MRGGEVFGQEGRGRGGVVEVSYFRAGGAGGGSKLGGGSRGDDAAGADTPGGEDGAVGVEEGLQDGEGRLGVLGLAGGAAAACDDGVVGEFADYGELQGGGGVQGEDGVGVLEEDDTGRGELARDAVGFVAELGTLFFVLVAGPGSVAELEHLEDALVDLGFGDVAVFDILEEPGAAEDGKRHLEVEASFDGRGGRVRREPVGHGDALVAPGAAEDVGDQLLVLAAERTVDFVVSISMSDSIGEAWAR